MAIAPGIYNTTIQRRADFSLPLVFKDGDGNAINLTGWTVLGQAWNESRSTKYADFTTTYTDRVNGSVSLSLSYTQTAALPDEVQYDVMLINPSGLREYYLEGILYVSEGYTTP
jgi:hypothetical protein